MDAAVKTALATDPLAQRALIALPATDRSVANALQLWDGDWTSQSTNELSDQLAPVRALVVNIIETAPAACRNAQIIGPRFIIVPVQNGADMVIVIGSGPWRWRDLIPERRPGWLRWLQPGR